MAANDSGVGGIKVKGGGGGYLIMSLLLLTHGFYSQPKPTDGKQFGASMDHLLSFFML